MVSIATENVIKLFALVHETVLGWMGGCCLTAASARRGYCVPLEVITILCYPDFLPLQSKTGYSNVQYSSNCIIRTNVDDAVFSKTQQMTSKTQQTSPFVVFICSCIVCSAPKCKCLMPTTD